MKGLAGWIGAGDHPIAPIAAHLEAATITALDQAALAVSSPGVCVSLDDIVLACWGDCSQAESVARLWQAQGVKALQSLQSVCMVAVWQRSSRRLWLAGDRLGVHRLYYTHNAAGLGFCNSLDALLAGRPRPEIDPNAIYAYLNFGFVPTPYSIYRDVHKLPPAHVLCWQEGRLEIQPYWQPAYCPDHKAQADQFAPALMETLQGAVTRSSQGGGVKGAFLSGGTDSSTVAGLMARQSTQPVPTFSIGFEDPQYNELDYARIAAHHFGLQPHEAIVTAEDTLGAIDLMVSQFEEPFGNNSAVAGYFCAKLARDHGVDVLLAGDGGDEVFGGNERYRSNQLFRHYQALPGWLRQGLIEPALRLPWPDRGLIRKGRRYIYKAKQPTVRRYYEYEFHAANAAADIFTPDFLAQVDPELPWALAERHYQAAPASSELDRLLYLDLQLTIADNDLCKVTRTAALTGVEVRFPLLDPALVEFSCQIPASLKMKNLQKRYMFKYALRDFLPQQIIHKTKHGFGLPFAVWLRSEPSFRERLRDVFADAELVRRGVIQPGFIPDLVARHQADHSSYYGDILWMYMMLELWLQRKGS